LRLSKDPISIFLINRYVATEKIRKRNGENINNFFNNIELGLFKWILWAEGISN